MPGVPTSLACQACRRQKKGCDLQKPACGRCKRLGVECVGGGVKQWKFKDFETPQSSALGPVRAGPSNGTTRVASSLVFILGVKDLRHDLSSYGSTYFLSLPKRVGSHEAFDSSISAMVATYDSLHGKGTRVDALAAFGNAMTVLRKGLDNDTMTFVMKLYTIFNIYICQEWLGSDNPNSTAHHREVLAHLFEQGAATGEIYNLEEPYIYGLCQLIAYESLVNPRIKLGNWFWRVLNTVNPSPKPSPYYPGKTCESLDLETLTRLFLYFREPVRYHYQLQCMYKLLLSEKPAVWHQVQNWTALANSPAASDTALRVLVAYQAAYGTMLAIGAKMNRVLRLVDPSPQLVAESCGFCDEAIEVAGKAHHTRPFGAHFVPKFMRVVYAATADGYRRDDIEAVIADFERDFAGAHYVVEARWIADRFNEMEKAAMQKESDSMLSGLMELDKPVAVYGEDTGISWGMA